MKTVIKRSSSWLFLILMCILIGSAFVTYNKLQDYKSSVNWVIRSHNIKANIMIIRSNVKNAEIGQLRYIDTKNNVYLQPIINLEKENKPVFDELEILLKDNKLQQENLRKVMALCNEQYNFLDKNLEILKNVTNSSSKQTYSFFNVDKNIVEIRQKLQQMLQAEDTLLYERVQKKSAIANNTPIFLLLLFLLSMSLLYFYFLMLQREVRMRVSKETLLDLEQESRKKIEESERVFKSIFENSLAGILISDDKGNFISGNNAAAALMDHSLEELMQMNISDIKTVDCPDAAELFEEYLADYKQNAEFNIITKDNKPRTIQYQAIRIKENFHLSIMMDVTNKKLYAEELVKGREKALLEKENAVKAAHAKQQFLSNMSHEIRTPMNAIIGFTKVLSKTSLSPIQSEYLQAIKSSGETLIVLINDILDLAKVDAGKMIFVNAPFNIGSSLTNMLHLFDVTVQEKNLKLIKIYDDRIPEVLIGDSVRLHQILINLLSNAIKFTSKGSITVEVALKNTSDAKVTLQFTISDTGIGISKNKLHTIFNDFEQAEHNTSSFYGGTGLGLAIVKQLVEKQGGTITVNSELDHGSSFTFALDFLKTNSEIAIEDASDYNQKILNDVKVLVAEDVKLNQLLIKTILAGFQFDFDIVDNGKIAIEKLQNNSYDVILMDLQMPIMNGFEATDHIRNIMKLDIPIIALTADVTTVDIDKCKSVGMNDYIAKPFDEKLLYKKIADLVK